MKTIIQTLLLLAFLAKAALTAHAAKADVPGTNRIHGVLEFTNAGPVAKAAAI